MADENVESETPSQQRKENGERDGNQKCVSSQEEAENQSLSKRQRKKLLKQQKWEEERELRK